MPETIKVAGATQLLLAAADVNDQVGVFVVLAAYSAFVLSGRSQNSEDGLCGANHAALSRHGNDGLRAGAGTAQNVGDDHRPPAWSRCRPGPSWRRRRTRTAFSLPPSSAC